MPLDVGSSEDGDGQWDMEAVGNVRLDLTWMDDRDRIGYTYIYIIIYIVYMYVIPARRWCVARRFN